MTKYRNFVVSITYPKNGRMRMNNMRKKMYITCGGLAVVMQGDNPVSMCATAVERFGSDKDLNSVFLLSEKGFRYNEEDEDVTHVVPMQKVVMGDDGDNGEPEGGVTAKI
jgi:hypothetical protein